MHPFNKIENYSFLNSAKFNYVLCCVIKNKRLLYKLMLCVTTVLINVIIGVIKC